MLELHFLTKKLAPNMCFWATNFLSKNSLKISPNLWALFCGPPPPKQKTPAKFLPNFLPWLACKKPRKIHQRASARCAGTKHCAFKFANHPGSTPAGYRTLEPQLEQALPHWKLKAMLNSCEKQAEVRTTHGSVKRGTWLEIPYVAASTLMFQRSKKGYTKG